MTEIKYQENFLLDWISCLISRSDLAKNVSYLKLCTVDNPGWMIKAKLGQSELAKKPFSKIERDLSKDDWVSCHTIDNTLYCAGSPQHLIALITIFHCWVTDSQPTMLSEHFSQRHLSQEPILQWYVQWYSAFCDGDWEHSNGFSMEFFPDKKMWKVLISLEELMNFKQEFEPIDFHDSNDCWLKCYKEDEINLFCAECSSTCLVDALKFYQSLEVNTYTQNTENPS